MSSIAPSTPTQTLAQIMNNESNSAAVRWEAHDLIQSRLHTLPPDQVQALVRAMATFRGVPKAESEIEQRITNLTETVATFIKGVYEDLDELRARVATLEEWRQLKESPDVLKTHTIASTQLDNIAPFTGTIEAGASSRTMASGAIISDTLPIEYGGSLRHLSEGQPGSVFSPDLPPDLPADNGALQASFTTKDQSN